MAHIRRDGGASDTTGGCRRRGRGLNPRPPSIRQLSYGKYAPGLTPPPESGRIVQVMVVTRRSQAWGMLVDTLLAATVGVLAVIGSQWGGAVGRHPFDPLGYALVAAAVSPLVVRRIWPVWTLVLTVAAASVYLGLSYPYGPIFFAPGIALYTVAAAWPWRRSVPAGVAAVVAIVSAQLIGTAPAQVPGEIVHLASYQAWLLGLPFAAGLVIRLWRESHRRDHEDAARRLAYEERLQVARDVHDVVGHGLAVINMQAGVALHVLERRPEQAAEALNAIKQISKDALEDLRGTLALFRQPDPANGARRPPPGLDQLDSLVATMADSGLSVDLQCTGERVKLPAAVDLAAYRILQESLTNVLRHAGSASATVRVDYAANHVGLEVSDRGRGRAARDARPGGHGIVGMRERASAIGGSLEAGPRPDAGFQVRAVLPLVGAAP